jgi:hypothetical protein
MKIVVLRILMTLPLLALFAGVAFTQTPNAWGYSTGYGNVYGTFGLAQTMQSMYNVARAQSRNRTTTATPTASRAKAPAQTYARAVAPKNYGRYVPNAAVDTGKAFSEALGETPEERALIKQIYSATRNEFDKEAARRGWQNNIAAGLTFFTVTALTAYYDTAEPNDASVLAFYSLMNSALDEMPELNTVSNKDKQHFNNMVVGFGGLLLAGYSEAKRENDGNALASNKKLAAMLMEMLLKTDPENIRIENGEILVR